MHRFALLLGLLLVTGSVGPVSAQTDAPQVLLAPVPGPFQVPVAMTQHPESDDLYIVEKVGYIRAVRSGLIYDPVPVLDLSSEVSSGLEQGLLGLAFAPKGNFMYVYFTDSGGDSRLVEFAFSDGAVVLDSRRKVLSVEQPFENHNGGTITFGPDGYLYISLGDGGSAGDPEGNAQNLKTLRGTILRIDPRPSGKKPYRVPADNPFAGRSARSKGSPPHARSGRAQGKKGNSKIEARPEIWAYGLRNPWKYSFDRKTGDLWIGDVGQSAWEEINLQRSRSSGGENYGWNQMEGMEPYEGGQEPANHVSPIYVYPNAGTDSCSITGGYVYRGEAISSLKGAYVYSDWCDGRLRYIRNKGRKVVEDEELGVTVPSITSFGEDHDGELYAISLGGGIFKILPAQP
jgi:glucose/arabinose dehydrogenase